MALKAGLDLDASRFGAELEKATNSAVSKFQSMANKLAAIKGVAFNISTITAWGQELDRVGKLASRLGVSAETMQRIGAAAGQAGVSTETVAKQMSVLVGELTTGGSRGEKMAEALGKLGINAEEFISLPMDQQLIAIAEGLEKAEGQGTDLTNVYALLGSKGIEMTNLLGQGSAALRETMQSAAVVSDKTVANVQRANDNMARLGNSVKAFLMDALMKAYEGGVALYGILGRLIQRFGEISKMESLKNMGANMIAGAQAEFDRINAPAKTSARPGALTAADNDQAMEERARIEAERNKHLQEEEARTKRINDLRRKLVEQIRAMEERRMDEDQKLESLRQQKAYLDDMRDYFNRNNNDERRLEVEIERLKIVEKIDEIEEKRIKKAEELAKLERDTLNEKQVALNESLHEAVTERRRLDADLGRANRERLTISLAEAAAGEGGSRRRVEARNIERLERQAKRLFLAGDEKKGLETLGRADALRGKIKGLAEGDANPNKALEEALQKQTTVVEDINKALDELQGAIAG